jgi:glutamine amidotransferase
MIVIIDYKTGNIGSLSNMLKKIGAEAIVSSNPSDIEKADKLILPGVGAFDVGMKNLKDSGLIPLLEDRVLNKKTPILGICLGMQLLAEKSEEGSLNGLSWIKGEVKRFKFDNSDLKIPHMGWNVVKPLKEDSLFSGMKDELRFYFVHSYHFVAKDKDSVLATTNYGYDFTSVVAQENIFGVQFHPEKSHKFGMRLLDNFTKLC